MSECGTFAPWTPPSESDSYWGHTCHRSAHHGGTLQISKVAEPRCRRTRKRTRTRTRLSRWPSSGWQRHSQRTRGGGGIKEKFATTPWTYRHPSPGNCARRPGVGHERPAGARASLQRCGGGHGAGYTAGPRVAALHQDREMATTGMGSAPEPRWPSARRCGHC
jgi:hypothetical protein